MNINPLFSKIIITHDIKDVQNSVNEAMHDFVSEDWKEEFEDIFEAYEETGRNGAEHQEINSLINQVTHGHPILNSDHCTLFDKLAEHYGLQIN